MTSRITSSGGSPPRRALVQPALPLILIKQPIGLGTFECSLICPSPLRNISVGGTLTRANLNESAKTASSGTDKSGKLEALKTYETRFHR
jgi:hypothetical protein